MRSDGLSVLQMPTSFVIKDDWGHFRGWDVEFPSPPVQLSNVIDAVLIFNLQHSPFGQSVSAAHEIKTTTTAGEAEWLR